MQSDHPDDPSTTDRTPAARSGHAARLVKLGVDMHDCDCVVALAGNPNTGKSTVFNALTGLRQHTGNWPGKTVARAEGAFSYEDARFKIVDLPGTYSLLAASADEEVARNFILFGQPDVTVIVVDATRLERNLNLVLQVLEITDRAVVCLNLMDEAKRHRLEIDVDRLATELGIPVVSTSARHGRGIAELLAAIHATATRPAGCRPRRVSVEVDGVKNAAGKLAGRLAERFPGLANNHWVALRLLDGDRRVGEAVRSRELVDLALAEGTFNADDTADGTDDGVDATGQSTADADDILKLASSLRWEVGPDFHQKMVEAVYTEAAAIADRVTLRRSIDDRLPLDRTLDRLLTGRWTGLPAMVLMLGVVLWITVVGANVPSRMLSLLLIETVHPALHRLGDGAGVPAWLSGLLLDGVYLTTAWVVAVMLPPMAIFFPLFTLLEDFGYLPRVAFNMDPLFRRCGAHGKQALTTCMGFGCNAAGVIATRVIDSPRERLIAIITNNFALCNGRWPTQILIATIFLGALVPAHLSGIVSTAAVVGVALLGIALTLAVSWGLSCTLLRGEPSTFSLELPPYRPPRIAQTLYTSLIDRTVFVLWRAVVFAAPAGAAIWLISNIDVGGASIAEHCVRSLDPIGLFIGLNGVILLAYVVAIPANEIVLPTIVMLTVMTTHAAGVGHGSGVLFEEGESVTAHVLRAGDWTLLTAVNVMLFSLIHNPCSTTVYTIWKETRSTRWTVLATLLPLAMGLAVCLAVARLWLLVAT